MTEDKLNGYPVIKATTFVERQGYLPTRAILVDKENGEWVTALHCTEGDPHKEWVWGHYFRDETEARLDYDARAAHLLNAAAVSVQLDREGW